jgi:hypothetical protein
MQAIDFNKESETQAGKPATKPSISPTGIALRSVYHPANSIGI